MSRSKPITEDEANRMKLRPEQIGDMIKTRRLALCYSKVELAAVIGVDPQTVTSWEAGRGDATSMRFFNFIFAGQIDRHVETRALKAETVIHNISNLVTEFDGVV